MKKHILAVAIITGIVLFGGCLSPYSIDEKAAVKTDGSLYGIWKSEEDTDAHNYIVIGCNDDYYYAVSYMNKGGDNRGWENMPAFISNVKAGRFINTKYRTAEAEGWYLLRILGHTNNGFRLTAAVVDGQVLEKETSSKAVRAVIERRLDDPKLYSDTLHFVKKLPMRFCGAKE